MLGKPAIQEVDRRSFVGEAFAIQSATVMIHNEAVAGLTIETTEPPNTRRISTRGLNKKIKIDGNALPTGGGTMTVGLTTGSLAKLGLCAHRTRIQFAGDGDRGNTNSMMVEIGHMT